MFRRYVQFPRTLLAPVLMVRHPSTMHRVVSPTGADNGSELTPRRQSIAFFCNPNANTMVECLPGCVGEGAKYPIVRTEDYLVKR